MKQKQISIILGIHQSDVSRILSGARKVSWPLAEKLADLFPGKSIREWKQATPEELRRVSYPLAEKLSDIFPWKSMKQWRNASPDEIREAFSHLRESE